MPSTTARGLSLAGLVLLVLFLTIAAAPLFPIGLLDPGWQLRLAGAVINSSPLALTGLALLHLAAHLDPRDRRLVQRRRLAARLAVPVVLGFLLLIPLLSSAAVRQQAGQSSQQAARLSRASSQLEALRAAVRAASSPQDLGQRLVALQGPQLEPGDRGLPLPELQRRVNAVLDQAAGQIDRQQAAIPAANPWRLAPEILRTSVACLALAVGFAGLAQRPGAELPLLLDLLAAWYNLVAQWSPRRPASRRGLVSPQEMVERLVDPEPPGVEPADPGGRR